MAKAVIMSVEAVLAAAILFSMLLIASQLGSFEKDYYPQYSPLRDYSDGVIATAKKTGAFDAIILNSDDDDLKSIVDSLPAAVCTQVEIYSSTPQITNLYYSYSPPCEAINDPPKGISYSAFAIRQGDTASYYWAKATSYMRG